MHLCDVLSSKLTGGVIALVSTNGAILNRIDCSQKLRVVLHWKLSMFVPDDSSLLCGSRYGVDDFLDLKTQWRTSPKCSINSQTVKLHTSFSLSSSNTAVIADLNISAFPLPTAQEISERPPLSRDEITVST